MRSMLIPRPFWAGLLLLAAQAGAAAPSHPMDPLTADEMLGAANLLLQGRAAQPGAVFQSIELREPSKQEVLSARRGTAAASRMATVFYRQNKRSFKTTVDLSAGTFTPPVPIPRTDGQLGLTITEVSDFSFVFQDPAFVAALALRGIAGPAQLQKVFVTPLTPGSFGLPEEARRIVKAQMYYTEGAGINLYARPIEGLQAIIDLDERRIVKLLDSGVVPIPAGNHNFDEASVGASIGLRPELRPIRISQPLGANFRIDGNFIEWQKWRFHARFEKRSGPVISLVTYDRRQVMYQGSLAEIFVPYQDPTANWFYRTYMDAGEFGFGLLASPLSLGLDVPENAVLLDGLVAAAIPDPSVPVVPLPLPRVMGVFERLTGNPAWRHYEALAGGLYEGRAEVELVVRSISQVGNYDYLLDWIFTQSGAMRVEVALTGIDAPKAVGSGGQARAGDGPALRRAGRAGTGGAVPQPSLQLPPRPRHRRTEQQLRPRRAEAAAGAGPAQEHLDPRTSGRSRARATASSTMATTSGRWSTTVAATRSASGSATSSTRTAASSRCSIRPTTSGRPSSATTSGSRPSTPTNATPPATRRTSIRARPGCRSTRRNNQSLVNRDIVLWLTIGHHHVTQAEDWPVLSGEKLSFELKPSNFFDRNPALDLRRAPFEVRR